MSPDNSKGSARWTRLSIRPAMRFWMDAFMCASRPRASALGLTRCSWPRPVRRQVAIRCWKRAAGRGWRRFACWPAPPISPLPGWKPIQHWRRWRGRTRRRMALAIASRPSRPGVERLRGRLKGNCTARATMASWPTRLSRARPREALQGRPQCALSGHARRRPLVMAALSCRGSQAGRHRDGDPYGRGAAATSRRVRWAFRRPPGSAPSPQGRRPRNPGHRSRHKGQPRALRHRAWDRASRGGRHAHGRGKGRPQRRGETFLTRAPKLTIAQVLLTLVPYTFEEQSKASQQFQYGCS